MTPLHIAVMKGLSKMVDVLINKGANIHTKGRKNRSLLVTASIDGPYMDILTKLIKRGVSVNSRDDNGITLLHGAVDWGRKEVCILAIAHGADVNAVSKMKTTPLWYAVDRNYLEIVQILLENGATHYGFLETERISQKINNWFSLGMLNPKLVNASNRSGARKSKKIPTLKNLRIS